MQIYCIGGVRGGSENQSVSNNNNNQVVDCGLWIVGPLLFSGCAKLLDIGRNRPFVYIEKVLDL